MIDVLILSISFYVFVIAVKEIKELFDGYNFSGLFKKKVEDGGVEIPVVELIRPKYDVTAFKRRIEQMRDDEGLFDIPDVPPVTDFTGAEVITENYELDMDRHIGSK